MRIYHNILCLFTLLVVCQTMNAQYDVNFSHYFDMEPYFNPAAVGKETKLNINAAYAMNLTGFKHNPRTMYLGADMPLYAIKQVHGVGVQLLNDQIGLFTHKRLSIQYAYKHRMFGGTISAGIQGGLIAENFDGSKVNLEDANDPAFSSSSINGNTFDMGAGVYYTHKQWYAGVSAIHITSPTVELGENNELKISAVYYLTGGYNIKFRNPFLTIKTSALGRTDGTVWRADLTSRLVYTNDNKIMYGGIAYSPTNSITFLIGGIVHGVMLGYSYELYTSALDPGNGSHELYVGYQMDVNLQKKGRNKHKSVRLL